MLLFIDTATLYTYDVYMYEHKVDGLLQHAKWDELVSCVFIFIGSSYYDAQTK